ncbi:putative cytokinesis regulator (Byr4) [Aspergillus clavatus NRRL 1]|uniref:Cytokinesis regulator (Byr4), putative n=1 Tax=Aspergillus clavatus (strain ATCC 1007 / CBS 513.65 / DSM 816 / NCTC 3887 / NRRL 1 / QM 1276 / 107) TaxID=344612 RepID=A1C4P5_ASPCL|nr:cytokinesis regulator (Byr4), putative [Aspergillus clavatus NRRL 1]EAW14663.1 cytokinesis regulator (Byr4), putative [Aspergillus clavatus NRRL 1]
MEPLTTQLRHGDEETIECWDDDGDLQCFEDIHIRTASTTTSITNSSILRSSHRDSISSRRSARSDLDSTLGDDEDWQVQLQDDDELLSEEAIASAKGAGIPLPANIPKSALIGGTIKRLGRRKPRRNFVDDWTDDVELPGPDTVLELKSVQETAFPESLRQLSSAATSPVKSPTACFWGDDVPTQLQSALTNLDRATDHLGNALLDTNDIDDDVPTIRVAMPRTPETTSTALESSRMKVNRVLENLESDFELPVDDLPLRLSTRKTGLGATSPTPEEFDVEWSEGSIGVRFGGTQRDHRSNPSSIVSVVSPSASSCLTGESEDEGLDGLIIPEGPLDLESSLKKRLDTFSPRNVQYPKPGQAETDAADTDDFLLGLDIESGGAFDLKKLSLNPNIKCKTEHPGSPARRSATSITFTNTSVSPKSRIPRLSSHDLHSTHLETVSESGVPLPKSPSSQFRVRGHASHASVSGFPSAIPSTSPTPSTSGRRRTASRLTRDSLSGDQPSARNQVLRTKRSMPTMRNVHLAATVTCSQNSQPQHDDSMRPYPSNIRPKTPVDRVGNDLRYSNRRSQMPFIPAGASEKQSHHVNVKSHRHSRWTNSDSSAENLGSQMPMFRHPRLKRQINLGSNTEEPRPEALITAPKQAITKPTRRRNFGDGSELESFDDLPTSSSIERRFIKNPTGRGVPKSIRDRFSQNRSLYSQMDHPDSKPTPGTMSTMPNLTPRFARDTNASRTAREERIASMASSAKNRASNALSPLSPNWRTQSSSRTPSASSTSLPMRSQKNKSFTSSGGKPLLIKPMGKEVQEPRAVNGMRYNPNTFRWEGNETSVHEFEAEKLPMSPKPAPALITNVGAMQNVQVVGGMVFDPQRMCWLKLAPSQPGAKGLVAVQLEDDIFAGLDDLEEKSQDKLHCGRGSCQNDAGHAGSGDDRSLGYSSDEWPITEEFDVGPEFIRRQRVEEDKWRRKVDRWVSIDRSKAGQGWRWAIRDIVGFNSVRGALGAPEFHGT